MKLSLVSKVLHDRPPEQVIDVAALCDYQGVEWFCLPQHLPPDTSERTAQSLADRLLDADLEVPCLSTYAGGFADLDDAASEAQLGDFRRYLRLAELFDCPLLRIWPDTMGRTLREPVSSDTLQRVARYVQRAADDAALAGRRVALEMHQTIGADAALLRQLLESIDRPNVGLIYDPANLYLAGYPHLPSEDPALQLLAPRFFHVQLKDGDLLLPTPPRLAQEPTLRFGGTFDLLLGEGKVNLTRALGDLRDSDYDAWLSVETHAAPRPDLPSPAIAAHEINTLRTLLTSL